MTAYEEAVQRYNAAMARLGEAYRAAREAEDEADEAAKNLARYEDRPGIPKAEYR